MFKPAHIRLWASYLLTIAGLLVLTGCGPDVARWKEEVLLHDGRMIVVERMAKAAKGGITAPRGRDLEFEISYKPLGIYWHDTSGNQQTALEIFDGIPYLVLVYPGDPRIFCKDKPPGTLPIQVLKMQGKEWVAINTDSFPVDVANYNLYHGYWGNKASEDARGLITWKHKEGMNSYPIARFENGFAIRRPGSIREMYVNNLSTCARYQDPHK